MATKSHRRKGECISMALTRKMLKAMGIEEEKIEQIIEAHAETVDTLKEQRDTFKADADKLAEVQKELDEAKKNLENAGKDTAVGEGAVWYGDGAVGQQGTHGDMPGSVRQSLQVGLILPFPASAEKFRLPSAAFGEPCIAQLAFIHQHLPPSLIHCLLGSCNRGLRHPCKSLIPLTMVISTDIIELVVGVVIAAYRVS